MGKPSPPKPPDPQETAAAQQNTNVNTALANTFLGNVNQITPDGTLTYSYAMPDMGAFAPPAQDGGGGDGGAGQTQAPAQSGGTSWQTLAAQDGYQPADISDQQRQMYIDRASQTQRAPSQQDDGGGGAKQPSHSRGPAGPSSRSPWSTLWACGS